MKPILTTLALLMFYQFGFSQSIVVPDKKWEGLYGTNPDNWFQAKFRSITKTIDENDYLELMYKVEPGGWFEGSRRYYREESNKVYRYVDGEEKLVLDLGLSVGDTVELVDDFGDRFEFFPIRVVDTLVFNNQLRKLEMRVKLQNGEVSNVPHLWVEGVGDVGFFFDAEYVFGNLNATPIFCVSEDDPFYSTGLTCPNLVSTPEISDRKEFDFRYDQVNKKFYLENESDASLEIYSLLGQILYTYNVVDKINGVDLSLIPAEICVIVIRDGNHIHSKLLKL